MPESKVLVVVDRAATESWVKHIERYGSHEEREEDIFLAARAALDRDPDETVEQVARAIAESMGVPGDDFWREHAPEARAALSVKGEGK